MRRAWWFSVVLAGLMLLVWLGSVARRGAPTWPVADGALIEIYTMHAARGEQLLGAYSQYGWFHPGPLVFYLLAPFYAIGGHTLYGLDLGALAINVASLWLIAAVLGRRRSLSPVTSLLLLVGLFVYLARLPDLLTSAWNPHISVWPFAALLVCTAAVVDGQLSLIPVVVVLASLVTHTHVGFTPAAMVMGAIALAGLAWRVAAGRESRQRSILWLLLSVVILQLIWLPVFAEELTGHPGNLTKIWQFFFETAETQTSAATIRAWSSMLMGIIRPDLGVAIGIGFAGSHSTSLVVLGLLSVIALPVAAVARWRDGHRFEAALAAVCFVASVIGFWSVLHIRGLIGDYQLFWLSILGVFNLMLTLGLIGNAAGQWVRPPWMTPGFVARIAVVFVIAGVLIGAGHLVLATRSGGLPDENESVRRLTEEMRPNLQSMGAHKPLFRLEGNTWGVGVGLMLQLARASIPFAVDDSIAKRFDPTLAPNGQEDVLITVSSTDRHPALALRPGSVTLAASNWRVRLYVDAVSLVDHPEFRTESGRP